MTENAHFGPYRVTLTFRETLQGKRQILRRISAATSFRVRFMALLSFPVVFLILIVLGLIRFGDDGEYFRACLAATISFFGGVAAMLLISIEMGRAADKIRWSILGAIYVEISDLGVSQRTAATSYFAQWGEIEQVSETPELVVLIARNLTACILPLRALPTLSERDAFLAFARSKVEEARSSASRSLSA